MSNKNINDIFLQAKHWDAFVVAKSRKHAGFSAPA
jgi:hypothetical protein